MLIEYGTQIITILALLVISWILPSLSPASLTFGVRIPPTHQDDSRITTTRRNYTIGLVIIAIIVFSGTWALAQQFSPFWVSLGAVFVTLILLGIDYYVAHRSIATTKQRENWYAGLNQAIAVDTDTYNESPRLPLGWLVLTLAIVAAMFIVAALQYPALPARIPTHFGLDGTPNQWSDKSWGAFSLPIIAAILTAMFIAIARFLPNSHAQLDPADIEGSRAQLHGLRNNLGRMILIISAVTNAFQFIVALAIWQIIPIKTMTTLAIILTPLLLVVIILVILGFYYQQAGPRHRSNQPKTQFVMRDDDRYWKAGMFYVNTDDPSVFVPKRFGLGWTINFGHPLGRGLMVLILVIVLSASFAGIFLHH